METRACSPFPEVADSENQRSNDYRKGKAFDVDRLKKSYEQQ
jgi:hypothetical protein